MPKTSKIDRKQPTKSKEGVEIPVISDHIHGFSTDADSDDDDTMVAETPALDVSHLPTVAKDDVVVQKRLQRAKSKPVSTLNSEYLAAHPSSYRQ